MISAITIEDYDETLHRAWLELITPDGYYTIGAGDFKIATGKGGYIDFEVTTIKYAIEQGIAGRRILFLRKQTDMDNYNKDGINIGLIKEMILFDPEKEWSITVHKSGILDVKEVPVVLTYKSKDLPENMLDLLVGEMVNSIRTQLRII